MSGRTRLAVSTSAVLLALALSASAAFAAPVGTITADQPSSEQTPLTVSPGPTGLTVTFTNSDKSKSTSALVVSLAGTGFSITTDTDTCTGTALGPRKRCSVTVAYTGSTPTTGQTATLTVAPKSPPPDPVVVHLKVDPLTPRALCTQLGGVSTLHVNTWIACNTRGVLPPTADIFAVYDQWFTAFQVTCAANGYPGSFVYGTHFDDGYWISVLCDNHYAAERELCADNGQALKFLYDTMWECSGVALADQAAADALAAQFKAFCDLVDPPGFYPLELSVVPDGTGVRATFTCRDPNQPFNH